MNTALLFSLKGYIEGVHQGWSLTLVSPGVRSYFQAYIIVVKIQFLARNEIKDLSVLLVVSWRPPLLPCHMALSTKRFMTWQFASSKPARNLLEKWIL